MSAQHARVNLCLVSPAARAMIGVEREMSRFAIEARSPRSESLLSLGEAARLVGCSKRDLRERIERGELAVYVHARAKRSRVFVTPSALCQTGLLASDGGNPTGAPEIQVLLGVLREQGARLAEVEDQRAQLAGQLGAALERLRLLEARLDAMATERPADRLAVMIGMGGTTLGVMGVIAGLGAVTLRRAARTIRRIRPD
ncbi:MAG: hypothetical protein C4346_07880 [Chloroflexota bacterium]